MAFATLLLALGFVGTSLWTMNRQVLGLFHDEGIYVTLAKSLSEGTGLRLLNLPSTPVQTKYPVVYPYLLSWMWWLNPVFPDNIFLLKVINEVFFFAVLLLSGIWIHRHLNGNTTAVLLSVVLIGGNPGIFSVVNLPLSEILFLMFVLLALLGFDREEDDFPSSVSIFFLASIAALAYLTRTVGVAVIGAGFLHLLKSRRWRLLWVYSVTVLSFVVPWVWWQRSHAGDGVNSVLLHYYIAYDHQSPAFILIWSESLRALQILWGNLRYAFEGIGSLFLLDALPVLKYWLYSMVGIGFVVSLHKHTVFFWSFLFLYSFLILTWPWNPARFLLPLLPPLLLFLLRGVSTTQVFLTRYVQIPWFQRRVGFFVRLPFVGLLLINGIWLSLYLSENSKNSMRLWFGQQVSYEWQGFEETFTWIREHTKEGDVLATAYDPMYYLYTGRQAIRPWFYKPETYFYPYGHAAEDLGSPQEIKRELTTLGVRYLIIDPLDSTVARRTGPKLFEELLHSYGGQAQEVFVSSDGLHKVYTLPQRDEEETPS
jgi:hypothetical protein